MSKKRNTIGDVESPNVPKDFWEKQRQRRYTHVFHFKDTRGVFMPVDYDGIPLKDLGKGFSKFELLTIDIFKSPPKPPWDAWIDWKGKYRGYLIKHFRPVLATRRGSNDISLDIDKVRMVIEKNAYGRFRKFITEFRLADHEDFILFLLAKIEEVYLEEVEFYDNPKQQERIRNFPREIEKLIKALKLSSRDFRYQKGNTKSRATLEQVTFHFNTQKPIKITDHLLTSSIADATRNSYDNASFKNWEKQLRRYPSVYTENQQPNEFRYRICKALHNFFKDVNAFEFKDRLTTDAEVYAIAWMLDFVHVKFSNKRGIKYDLIEDRYDLRQIVRLHIRRKELKYTPTHYTAKELKPNLEKLGQYFSDQFIRTGSPIYKEHDILQVFTISDRFGVNDVFPELLQIFTSLESYHSIIGHQFEAPFNQEIIKINKDYEALKALLDVNKTDKKIQSFGFKIKGKRKNFIMSEVASFEILTQAIKEYHKNHPADFEVDFYETTLDFDSANGGFKLIPSGKLNVPSRRFLPSFVRNCYDFLLKESPPNENDFSPSETYYGVIALLLMRAWYFRHQMWDERQIVEQVKYWHRLNLP